MIATAYSAQGSFIVNRTCCIFHNLWALGLIWFDQTQISVCCFGWWQLSTLQNSGIRFRLSFLSSCVICFFHLIFITYVVGEIGLQWSLWLHFLSFTYSQFSPYCFKRACFLLQGSKSIPEEYIFWLNFLRSVLNSRVRVFIFNLIKESGKPICKFLFQSVEKLLVITEGWLDYAITIANSSGFMESEFSFQISFQILLWSQHGCLRDLASNQYISSSR